ncbi:MAG: hypothetical protein AAF215_15345 [Cyanobacteria bacterium P01_A01_bin.123]
MVKSQFMPIVGFVITGLALVSCASPNSAQSESPPNPTPSAADAASADASAPTIDFSSGMLGVTDNRNLWVPAFRSIPVPKICWLFSTI